MTERDSYTVGPQDDPDKYRLIRQVGSGGEAELWQAAVRVAGADETVAVKILRAAHALDPEAWQQRWREQAEVLRLLRHPGVVGVHEFFTGPRMHLPGEADADTRHHYLVMNWVEGVDLRQWVAGERDRFEALRHLVQLAEVLDWLHSGEATPSGRPVVHGDLSPGNVIVNSHGQTVLVDFGLSKLSNEGTREPVGTQGYCAPEVTQYGVYGNAADCYAFGALTYFTLTGTNPPSGDAELRQALVDALRPMFDGAEPDAIASIAAHEPGDRPAAGQWLRDLRPHATTAAPRETPLPPTHSTASKPRRPAPPAAVHIPAKNPVWPWAVGGVATTLMLTACGIGVFLWGASPSGSDSPAESSESMPEESEGLLLTDLEPSDIRGFKEAGTDPLTAPCDKRPYVEYTLDGNYSALRISASTGDTDETAYVSVTMTGYTSDQEFAVPADETNSQEIDIADADTVRIGFNGADSGDCTLEAGWLKY
ncbi:serine/threonine protein kinase [Stackebrandtia nassauensis]|uniref:non-specific serine/threonine protein kinase n=1 Tax=Stackebrandtia nassauensis (strain DSM 44728 / CIP 108903 / NRRL B-16338 / NBRC 102104 / LLR-40K-21) TaxID=446470 RepID=D3PWT3_STANL|nr:serine/threonine-protein kinase [Stackebrandtia nassauensis]ADD43305.1 serine/threonine protein kinase [Stackebrandtia nassauensis DSM 44728]